MNCGAVLSLSAFMMHDVLILRLLSMCGTCCGMAFNFTRQPRQINAVAWGMVFISVNALQVRRC
jgi:hypothetical protein